MREEKPPAGSEQEQEPPPREPAPKEGKPQPEEMGGEAPCKLHEFWDVDEEK
jgi:hypothetical protein